MYDWVYTYTYTYTHTYTWVLLFRSSSYLYSNAMSCLTLYMPMLPWSHVYLLSLACLTWHVDLHLSFWCKHTPFWAFRLAYTPSSYATIYEGQLWLASRLVMPNLFPSCTLNSEPSLVERLPWSHVLVIELGDNSFVLFSETLHTPRLASTLSPKPLFREIEYCVSRFYKKESTC